MHSPGLSPRGSIEGISCARKHSQGECTLHLTDLISTVGVILHCLLLVESFIPVRSEWEIIPISTLFMHV